MTNTKSNVNVKIDADVKNAAAVLLARMGLNQTTAIEMFYRKIIAENCLPFQPEPLPSLDEQLIAALERNVAVEYTLPIDENGHLFIDKDLYPDLYDWAVNG